MANRSTRESITEQRLTALRELLRHLTLREKRLLAVLAVVMMLAAEVVFNLH